jgi:hypothetical protein
MATKKLQVEVARSAVDYTAMTDSGDHKIFNVSGVSIFSGYEGAAPEVRPDGIESGINLLTPNTGTNDSVSVAAFTAFLAGERYTVSAQNVDISGNRPATAVAKVLSVCLDSDGATLNVEAGTDGATTTFSATRGAAGGPPEIPAGDIELGQVRLTSDTAGAVTASEIKQVPNQHADFAYVPAFSVNNIGDGNGATSGAQKNAYLSFSAALNENHASDAAKAVYISYSSPTLADVEKCRDFVPIETTHSAATEEHYDGTETTTSSSTSQGSFSAIMTDNVNDQLVAQKNKTLIFKFKTDENKSAYILTQAKMAIARTNPVSGALVMSATLTGNPSVEFSG